MDIIMTCTGVYRVCPYFTVRTMYSYLHIMYSYVLYVWTDGMQAWDEPRRKDMYKLAYRCSLYMYVGVPNFGMTSPHRQRDDIVHPVQYGAPHHSTHHENSAERPRRRIIRTMGDYSFTQTVPRHHQTNRGKQASLVLIASSSSHAVERRCIQR